MNFVKPSIISLAVLTLLGCSSNTKTYSYTQADIDLLIERTKVEERQRISRELDRQAEQRRVFDSLLARQNAQYKTVDKEADSQSQTKSGKSDNHNIDESNPITTIIPQSYKPVLYKEIAGISYMRCAELSLVPIPTSAKSWTYKTGQKELSATLCKGSRDKMAIQALQQKLYDMKLLSSDVLTKEQIVDGVWNERTLTAVKAYQAGNGLLYGSLTIEVLEHLGIFEADEERVVR